jgi:putative transposase
MFLSVRFKCYPTLLQEQLFEQNCGNRRFVYNWALDLCMEHYKKTGKTFSFYDLCHELGKIRNTKKYEWLQLTPIHTLNASLQDLVQAYSNMFHNLKSGRKIGHPTFKSKYGHNSFRIVRRMDYVDEGYIKLETIGWVKIRNSGGLERLKWGKIKSATISKDRCGNWYASVLLDIPDFEYEVDYKYKSCGIDLGIKNPITISKSNGRHAVKGKEFSNRLAKIEKRRHKAQRKLARAKNNSKNREKQKRRVARLYRKEYNIRKDWVEKTSYYLVTNYQLIIFEDLNIQSMTTQGSVYKRRLNNGMRRLGLGNLIVRTEAKAKLYGNTIEFKDPSFTSQRCSECGKIDKNSRMKSLFSCTSCGHTQNADKNASNNIRSWVIPARGRESKPV